MPLGAKPAVDRARSKANHPARASCLTRRAFVASAVTSVLAAPFLGRAARAAGALNAYAIWPENYARPMLEGFEKASGIHVNFVRFSSGEALARVMAGK